MKYTTNERNLTITLDERIDFNNSKEIEQEILRIIKENPCEQLILDAENLKSISSSGIRMLFRLSKSETKNLKIINVSQCIY